MKKFAKILFALVLLTGTVLLLSFVNKEQQNKTIWNFEVEVLGNQDMHFINEKMIKDQLASTGIQVLGTQVNELSLDRIQTNILKNPSIKESEVYKTIDGQLIVKVEQRTPIARIINSDGSSFYLDEDGQIMPLSRTYTARVPVVLGNLNENSGKSVRQLLKTEDHKDQFLLDDIFVLINEINKNDLIKSLTDCVIVNDKREFEIVPRIGSQRIVVGQCKDLDIKFKKLLAFYDKIIQNEPLDQYAVINLKFRDQIVCVNK